MKESVSFTQPAHQIRTGEPPRASKQQVRDIIERYVVGLLLKCGCAVDVERKGRNRYKLTIELPKG